MIKRHLSHLMNLHHTLKTRHEEKQNDKNSSVFKSNTGRVGR